MTEKFDLAKIRAKVFGEFGKIEFPTKGYFICSSARSGTNMFGYSMQAMGYGMPREGFNMILNRKHGWGYEKSDLISYIRDMYSRQTDSKNDIFGLKIFWQQLKFYSRECDQIAVINESLLSDFEKLHLFFPYVRFIYLRRRNKLRQAISLARTDQDGLYLLFDDNEASRKKKAYYDSDQISRFLILLTSQDQLWQSFFEGNEIKPHMIWYEDLVDDYIAVMSQAVNYLDLPSMNMKKPPSKKQADNISDEWYDRFLNENKWLKDPCDPNSILANHGYKTAWAANLSFMPTSVQWKTWFNRLLKTPGYAAARAIKRISNILSGRK